MNLGLRFRDALRQIGPALSEELDGLVKRINLVWAKDHDPQSGHHVLVTLTDGITAPSAVSGKAIIYVDSADGDLKIVFGDGTTKTIVADT